MKGSLKLFQDELSKFRMKSFWYSGDIKSAASTAHSFLKAEYSQEIRISEEDSPLVNFIRAVFTNPRILRFEGIMVLRIIECVRKDLFSGPALTKIVEACITGASVMDMDAALLLLQYGTTCILKNPTVQHIALCLSLALEFMARPEPSISETAFATFQQMLTTFMDEKTSGNDSKQHLLGMITRDMWKLCGNETPELLMDVHPPPDLVYELLSGNMETFRDIVHSSNDIFEYLKLRITEHANELAAAPLIAVALKNYSDLDSDFFCEVFRSFFDKLQHENSDTCALHFFHRVALHGELNVFGEKMDDYAILYGMLFSSLVGKLENISVPITISMKPWRTSEIRAQTGMFAKVAVIDILVGTVKWFASVPDQFLVTVLLKAAKAIFSLTLQSIKFCAMKSFNKVFEVFKTVILILSKHNMLKKVRDHYESFERIFDDVDREVFFYNEKNRQWRQLITEFMVTSPELCEEHWEEFVPLSIASGVSSTFANEYSNVTKMDILTSAAKMKQFPRTFVVEFLQANLDQFMLLWPIVEIQIHKGKIDANTVFDFYVDMMMKCFSSTTEIELLRFALYMSKELQVDTGMRLKVLKTLLDWARDRCRDMREGWNYLLDAIRPSNFEMQKEITEVAFEILKVASYNHVPASCVMQYINVVFEFTKQTIDDSISVDALKLLQIMINRVEDWAQLFTNLAILSVDSRPEVSKSAMNWYFSVLNEDASTNTIPKMVLEKLVNTDLMDFINSLDNQSHKQHTLLHLIAKFCCDSWARLCVFPAFEKTLIVSLINKAEEHKANTLEFYSYFYRCKSLSRYTASILKKSIESRVLSISDIESAAADGTADLFSLVLTETTVTTWMPTIHTFVLNHQKPDMTEVHALIVHPLNIITSLFPLGRDSAKCVVNGLSIIISEAKSAALRRFVVDLLVTITERCEALIFECKHAFGCPEALPLLQILLSAEVPDESIAYDCYLAVTKREDHKLSEECMQKAIEMLPFIDNDRQQQFILNHYECNTMLSIWKRYFSKDSPDFDEIFFDQCFEFGIESMQATLSEWEGSDDDLISLLKFLMDLDPPGQPPTWYKTSFADSITHISQTTQSPNVRKLLEMFL